METKNRDYLANERTFLAYLRTALSFVAFGFVIARFSLFVREISVVAHITFPTRHASTTFGTAMAAAGILIGIYGTTRYLQTDRAIRTDSPEPMPSWAAIAGGVAVAAIGLVVAASLFEFR